MPLAEQTGVCVTVARRVRCRIVEPAGSMRSGCKKLRYLPTRGRVVGVGRAEAVRRHREARQAARRPQLRTGARKIGVNYWGFDASGF